VTIREGAISSKCWRMADVTKYFDPRNKVTLYIFTEISGSNRKVACVDAWIKYARNFTTYTVNCTIDGLIQCVQLVKIF